MLKSLFAGADTTSHRERLVSGAGAFLAILAIFELTWTVQESLAQRMLLMAPMAASAVLVFATPHGALSQPWNVIVGHTFAAFIGVVAHRTLSDPALAAASATGIAILVMRYTASLHPPAGATAAIAAVGGPAVDALGFWFVLFPVAANATLLVLAGIAVNAPFAWRRYPPGLWTAPAPPAAAPDTAHPPISHADLVAALSQVDTFVDVSEDDLLRIYELATGRRAGAGTE